ncbi:MAG: YlmH/Sll1252 family protein [Eubacteriales bacterium]|nr:YlmH/Sll1252 family protein [Eubacteriales bacterium]
MAETDKELALFKKRMEELADRAWRQSLFVFTGFLSLAEQEVLWEAAAKTGVRVTLQGGAEFAERQMARFGDASELGYEEPFPIRCLFIEPLSEKFADAFTHRDFLGAVLNLGIDRSTVGDIFVEGKKAWLFCTEAIAPFLSENLVQVRHTRVRCLPAAEGGTLPERRFESRQENAASLRCDGIVAAVWRLSRSQSMTLVSQKKVYINGRLTENGSRLLKEGDVVSVRGMGKFIFRGEKHTTKKGRLVVEVDVFV